MPDPQVLYIVTAVVVLGLVAWVIVVLARPERKEEGRAARTAAGTVRRGAAEASEMKSRYNLPDRHKPWLQSHAEIHDEPARVAVALASSLPGETEEDDGPTGPNALILVTAVGRTDPGLKRKHNEDAYAILEDHQLFVIADGMGRHAAGEVASQLCVEAISEAFRTASFGPPRDPPLPRRAARLRGATLLANERILAAASENDAYFGHGDDGGLGVFLRKQPARLHRACRRQPLLPPAGQEADAADADHTLGAAGIQGKTATILSRAIGVEPSVEVDVQVESPLPGDVYLLCSDGLSRMVVAERDRGDAPVDARPRRRDEDADRSGQPRRWPRQHHGHPRARRRREATELREASALESRRAARQMPAKDVVEVRLVALDPEDERLRERAVVAGALEQLRRAEGGELVEVREQGGDRRLFLEAAPIRTPRSSPNDGDGALVPLGVELVKAEELPAGVERQRVDRVLDRLVEGLVTARPRARGGRGGPGARPRRQRPRARASSTRRGSRRAPRPSSGARGARRGTRDRGRCRRARASAAPTPGPRRARPSASSSTAATANACARCSRPAT